MWVDPRARGLGLGRRLLRELESHARAMGARSVRLETNRSLTEAIALYRSSGYVEVPAFNDEPHAHLWFEKQLHLSAAT
jgi:ribosomal protein S18 acetylase RimI-like enzyme